MGQLDGPERETGQRHRLSGSTVMHLPGAVRDAVPDETATMFLDGGHLLIGRAIASHRMIGERTCLPREDQQAAPARRLQCMAIEEHDPESIGQRGHRAGKRHVIGDEQQ
jgi:hypothetical protein